MTRFAETMSKESIPTVPRATMEVSETLNHN